MYALLTNTFEAQVLSDHLAQLPHFHVVTLTDGQYLDYSDGLTEPGAMGYAADLISPTSGGRDETLEGVWIARADPKSCPLAHGDDPKTDSEDAMLFLERVMQFEPYWSVFG
jgi:hypothetical protein